MQKTSSHKEYTTYNKHAGIPDHGQEHAKDHRQYGKACIGTRIEQSHSCTPVAFKI